MTAQSQRQRPVRYGAAITTLGLVPWLVFLLINNAIWIRRHLLEFPPPWDQALYLRLSLRCGRALVEGGPSALYREAVSGNPYIPSLFPVTAGIFHALFSEARIVAHLTNGLYLFLLLLGVFGLARTLYGSGASLLAVFLASTFTGIVNFSRDCQMDYPGAALVTVGLFAVVRSERLRHLSWTLVAGAALGATALAKAMAVAFFVAPLVWAGVGAFRREATPARPLARLLLLLATAAIVASPWYGPHLSDIAWYLLYFGWLEGAAPYSLEGFGTFTIRNATYYPLIIVNHGISFLYATLFAVVALGRSLSGARDAGRPAESSRGTGLLGAWILGGYAILTLVPNKGGERYVLSLLPALAVLLAGSLMSLGSRRLRTTAIAAAVAIGGFNYAGLTYGPVFPPRVWAAWPPFEIVSHPFPHYVAFREMLGPGPGRPWPVPETLATLEENAAGLRAWPGRDPYVLERLRLARQAGDQGYIAAAYRLLLKRDPDPPGAAAYLAALRNGALTHEGVVQSIALSDEYRLRPLRVLVVPDHAVFNASTLLYYAELGRHGLGFEGPDAGLKRDDEDLLSFDAAIVKEGGNQGLRHVVQRVEALRSKLRGGPGLRGLLRVYPCPDGSRIEILVASGFP